MSSVTHGTMTAEQFLRMPPAADGLKVELVRGEVIAVCRPGFRHGLCQGRVWGLLDQYGRQTGHGRAVVETGIVTERNPDTVRGPDVSYWSVQRLPLDQNPEGYPEPDPDLCVEVLSPTNRAPRVRDKVREYFQREVRMVWVVDPEDRTVVVYRAPEHGRLHHEAAILSGDDVLPGFSCKVAELFS